MSDTSSYWTTLLSVLTGAGTTYAVQYLLELGKIRRNAVAAIRNAQLVLSNHYNFAARVSRTLEPYETADDRHAKFVKHYMPNFDLDVRMNDLAFFVQKNEAQTLIDISMAIESIRLLRQLIDEHHKAYDELFSTPKIERIEGAPIIVSGEFEAIKILRVKSIVDLLYSQSKDAQTRTKKCTNDLFRIGKKSYPRRKFIILP
jgi:hypothetical protein